MMAAHIITAAALLLSLLLGDQIMNLQSPVDQARRHDIFLWMK
jgi:hypothetical protein